MIRPTRPDETHLLPAIERSAGMAFSAIPELAWVAADDVLSAEEHRRLARAGTSWVAELDGHPVGFACAECVGADLHVHEVAVRRDLQGQGLGTRLMRSVEAHARKTDLARLTLTTFRDVPWNEPFYRRLGFSIVAPDALDDRLRRVLDEEAAAGFPSAMRCAMQMSLH